VRKNVSGERLAVSGKNERPANGRRIAAAARMVLCLLVLPFTAYRSPLTALQIQDNSFLIEEAYNQESGVVQHISTFALGSNGDAWGYSFTQEWPLGGIRHQLGYTIPVQSSEATGTGLADVALNYRYQLVGNPEARTVVAPRFSLLLPTGDDKKERGTGGLSFQANLPVTLVLSSRIVTNWNAGATVSPSARNPLGAEATATSVNLGGSVIWLLQPSFNLMVEALWLSAASVVSAGETARRESFLLNPGIRGAFNLANDLQIVPGLAYTFNLGPDDGEDVLFVYLSFEHPFKR
jgi:Putative MetA-pathway of phenol degradation